MENHKPTNTPVVTGTKLSKDDEGTTMHPTLYKSLVKRMVDLTATRIYIMYEINLSYRFMEIPKTSHWQGDNRILRYIVGTINFGIMYSTTNSSYLVG